MFLCTRADKLLGPCDRVWPNWDGRKEDCCDTRLGSTKISIGVTLVPRVQWSRDPEFQATFDGLKQAMMEGPLLRIADVTKPFKVETDASDYVLGVCSYRMDN
ncbi:putative mitochondrial protein [Cucumis melo var. makuwa]|uniref:Putative mitochondrial protein n=1 Tax=Cucumis melo var. makuwa TaxID=1194695 RepID=A0A5D3E7T6_CUCMM|nr:putative mitochondrial protein [Cucumis melo var. makuwa]